MQDDQPTAARSPWPRRLLLTGVGVAVVLVLAAGWLALRVYQAGTALAEAQRALPSGAASLSATDVSAVSTALPHVRSDLARARSAASDPVWRVAEHLPWAGAQLSAVRVVTVALDDVVSSAGPVLDRAQGVLAARDTLLSNGRVNLAPFTDVEPELTRAAQVSTAAAARVQAIDTRRLVHRLAGPVGTVQQLLPKLASALDTGSQLAALVPPMLGADGPRTYLVVALNSAELRSAGGIVGAVAAVQVDHGVVRLVDHRSTADFTELAQPVLPLTDAELAIDTDRLGRWVQDSVLTPDFPRSAQLIAAHWAKDVGGTVDGVIATDPIAVSYLLGAVGGVQTSSGTLDQQSAVPSLLRDPYVGGLAAKAADQYFAQAATAIFGAVVSGKGDPGRLVDAMAKAASDGRVRVWSAHPEEEQRLSVRTLGGAFLSGPYADATGVFLDDGTGGKLDYYLRTAVTVENLRCTGPTPTADVRLDLTYSPPADVASWPRETAGRATGFAPGSLVTDLTVYAAQGAALPSLRLGDDAVVSGLAAQQAGRQVQVVSSVLAPGQSATYRVQVPVRHGAVQVWATPTVASGGLVTATCPS